MTHHAWVTDGRGNAIDNTWDHVGAAYAGVPFDTDSLNLRHLQYEAIVCVLDDWEHGWPILNEPADRLAQWFAENGRGTVRLKGS